MKINKLENGVVITRDMTPEEIAEMHNNAQLVPYKQRVVNRIRAVYSMDDEIAIIRQRDTKPEEFEEYNRFVEEIKMEEKTNKTSKEGF